MTYYNFGPNRYICNALEEMREKLKLLSIDNLDKYKAIMAMAIEEVQTLANVMEAGLADWQSLNEIKEQRRKLKREIKKLEAKLEQLKEEGEESDKS